MARLTPAIIVPLMTLMVERDKAKHIVCYFIIGLGSWAALWKYMALCMYCRSITYIEDQGATLSKYCCICINVSHEGRKIKVPVSPLKLLTLHIIIQVLHNPYHFADMKHPVNVMLDLSRKGVIWKPQPTAISNSEWLMKSSRNDGYDFTAVFMIIIICHRTK